MARLALGGIWLHEGAWAKILDRDPSHREIVSRLPGMDAGRARAATTAIGVMEVGMAAWVLSGRRPRTCAAAQTVLMAVFNAGALTFAADQLTHPKRLLARNTGITALAWLAAGGEPPGPRAGSGRRGGRGAFLARCIGSLRLKRGQCPPAEDLRW